MRTRRKITTQGINFCGIKIGMSYTRFRVSHITYNTNHIVWQIALICIHRNNLTIRTEIVSYLQRMINLTFIFYSIHLCRARFKSTFRFIFHLVYSGISTFHQEFLVRIDQETVCIGCCLIIRSCSSIIQGERTGCYRHQIIIYTTIGKAVCQLRHFHHRKCHFMFHVKSNLTFQTVAFHSTCTCHQVILRIVSFSLIRSNRPFFDVFFKRICHCGRIKNHILIIWIICIEFHSFKFRTFILNVIPSIRQYPNTIFHGELSVSDCFYHHISFDGKHTDSISV